MILVKSLEKVEEKNANLRIKNNNLFKQNNKFYFNEFYLPTGMYHPKELAKLITDEMTSTTLTGAGLPADELVPANNRLLVSNTEIRELFKDSY